MCSEALLACVACWVDIFSPRLKIPLDTREECKRFMNDVRQIRSTGEIEFKDIIDLWESQCIKTVMKQIREKAWISRQHPCLTPYISVEKTGLLIHPPGGNRIRGTFLLFYPQLSPEFFFAFSTFPRQILMYELWSEVRVIERKFPIELSEPKKV